MTRFHIFIVSFFLGSGTFSCKGCYNEADRYALNELQDRVRSLEGTLANNQESYLKKLQEIENGLTAVAAKITVPATISSQELTEINDKIAMLKSELEAFSKNPTLPPVPVEFQLQQRIIDLERKLAIADIQVQQLTKQLGQSSSKTNEKAHHLAQTWGDLEKRLQQEIQKAILINEQLKQVTENIQKTAGTTTKEAIDAAIQQVKEDIIKEAIEKAEEKFLLLHAGHDKQPPKLAMELQEGATKISEEATKTFKLYKESTTAELHKLKDAIFGVNGGYGQGILQDISNLQSKTQQMEDEVERIDATIKFIFCLVERLIEAINNQVITPYNKQVILEKNKLKPINIASK